MPASHHNVEPDACLNCGCQLKMATNPRGDEKPSPGDATICLLCGHLMIFGPDLKMTEPSDQDILEMAGNPALIEATRISGLYREWIKTKDNKEERL